MKRNLSGKNNPFYGKKHSVETKLKIGLAHEGMKMPEHVKQILIDRNTGARRPLETGKKIAAAKIGKKRKPFSDLARINMSLSHIGKPTWIKGKHHTEQTKAKISESHNGIKNHNYGKPMPEQAKLKQSISKKNKPNLYLRGIKRPEEVRAKIRLARQRQVFPKYDTKPERMMQIALSLRGIKYEKHKAIIGQPDIFIEPNICVFVDGDYWHRLPKALIRDAEVNHELNRLGYQIIRIWEKDIKKDTNNCAKNIINLIQKLQEVKS